MAESRSAGVGVGAVYSGALAEPLADRPDLIDVVSVIPETLWHESTGPDRYTWIHSSVDLFDAATANYPVVFHGIGLSLGTAGPLDVGHLEQVAIAADRYAPLWVSEHLAAFRVGSGPTSAHAGVGLPIAFEPATLRMLAPKVTEMQRRLGARVLLENSAVYVDIPEVPWTEAGLLNRLCEATGCGVLLDLHNLFVNEMNLGWDGDEYLDELDLANVIEVHIAGGEHIGRWYTDAHSGAAPDRVHELLERLAGEADALRLATFELHESRYDTLGIDGFTGELAAIRTALDAANLADVEALDVA